MTIKHTPGPWRVWTPPPNGEQCIGDSKGLMVAVATTGITFNETLANARLIAAAPDLLEALQAIIESVDRNGAAILTELESAARAAIAKAQGEQQ